MMDLTPAKVFRSSAFEPSEEELKGSFRRRATESVLSDDEEMSAPSKATLSEKKAARLGDSDDELPDMSQFLAETCGPRVKQGRMLMEEEEEEEEGEEEEDKKWPVDIKQELIHEACIVLFENLMFSLIWFCCA